MAIAKLNKVQLGKYAESLVKIEFLKQGLEVYSAEVDDRGIDMVIGHDNEYYAVQVKSSRCNGYIYFQKEKFSLRKNLLAAIVLFDGDEPSFYLIPSLRWQNVDGFFVSRDYVDKKSKAEYGLNMSRRNIFRLEEFRLEHYFK